MVPYGNGLCRRLAERVRPVALLRQPRQYLNQVTFDPVEVEAAANDSEERVPQRWAARHPYI